MRKLLLLVAASASFAQTAYQSLARDVLKELIEINTTDKAGDNTSAAEITSVFFTDCQLPE